MYPFGRWGIVVALGLGAIVLVALPATAKKRAKAEPEPPASERDLGALARDEVNRLAARLNLPLFWRHDADSDRVADPGEVVGLLFHPTQGSWVAGGAFSIDHDAMPAAVHEMMQQVGAIKATGDRAAAEALVTRHVDGDLVPQAVISERMRRHPKATFVYALDF